MSELKEIYNADKKESSIKRIQEKLNILIEKEDSHFVDFTNATDHDYELPYEIALIANPHYFVLQTTKV